MDPTIAGAAMQAGGGLVSSAVNLLGGYAQRDWEEHMANTAYQRATADMRAAGLNPSLMYGSGSAAATPNVAAPQLSNPFAGMSDALMNSAKVAFETQRVQNETELNQAQVAKTKAEAATALLGPDLVRADLAYKGASTQNLEAERPNIRQMLAKIQADTQASLYSAASDKAGLPFKLALGDVAELARMALQPLKNEVQKPVPFQVPMQKLFDMILGAPGVRRGEGVPAPVESGGSSSAQQVDELIRERAHRSANSWWPGDGHR